MQGYHFGKKSQRNRMYSRFYLCRSLEFLLSYWTVYSHIFGLNLHKKVIKIIHFIIQDNCSRIFFSRKSLTFHFIAISFNAYKPTGYIVQMSNSSWFRKTFRISEPCSWKNFKGNYICARNWLMRNFKCNYICNIIYQDCLQFEDWCWQYK